MPSIDVIRVVTVVLSLPDPMLELTKHFIDSQLVHFAIIQESLLYWSSLAAGKQQIQLA